MAKKAKAKKAVKKVAKKAKGKATKRASNGTRNEMTHVVAPSEGSVREKLLKHFKAAKGDHLKATEAAIKAGINKFTARKQLYLMAKVNGKFTESARGAAE